MHQIPPLERAHVAAPHTIAYLAAAAERDADLDTFRAEAGFDERMINGAIDQFRQAETR